MPAESLATRSLRGIAWTFVGTGGQSVANIVVTIVLARMLTPADFGIVSAAMIVVSLTQIFSQLGVGAALVQIRELTSSHFRTALALSLSLGILTAVFIAAIAPFIANFFGMPDLTSVIRVLAPVFPIISVGVVSRALLQRDMQFRSLATIEFMSYLVYGLTGIVMAAMSLGVWALVWANIIRALFVTALLLVVKRQELGLSVDRRAMQDLLRLGTGVSLARIANYFANQADSLVVGRFLGAEALGIYGRAHQLIVMPANLIGSVLDRVMFPVMAEVQGDQTRLGRTLYIAMGTVFLLTMPIAGVLFVVAPELVLLLLGPAWDDVVTPFRVLIVVLAFRTGYKLSDSLARATGAVFQQALRHLIYALAMFGGAYFGLLMSELLGVAIGVSLAITLNFVLLYLLAESLAKLDRKLFLNLILRHTVIAGLVALLSFGAKLAVRAVDMNNFLTILISLLLPGAIWFAGFCYCPRVLGPEAVLVRRYLKGLLGRYVPTHGTAK